MSPPANSLFDDYPDDTRDEVEETDERYGMHEFSLLEQAQQTVDRGGIPSCDMTPEEVEAMAVDYPAERRALHERPWDFSLERDTFVISGPRTGFAVDKGVRGRYFEDHADAKAWVLETYGAILETITIPHKWAFRVLKPTAKGGRYTPPTPARGGK